MTRRTWWSFLLGAALVLLLTGCSGLTARGEMKRLIDDSAAVAASDASRAVTVAILSPEARTILKRNAETFVTYRDAKTLNLFAYWFGGKQIYVSGKYAGLLDRVAKLAEVTAGSADAQTQEWLNAAVLKEAKVLIDVANARAGKRSEP